MPATPARSPIAATISSLLIFFVLSYSLDSLATSIPEHLGEATNPLMAGALIASAIPFLLVAQTLAFARVHLLVLHLDRTSAAIVLVTGLILLATALPFYGLPMWLRSTPVGILRAAMGSFGLRSSFLYFMTVSCIFIGILRLLRPHPETLGPLGNSL